MGARIHPNGACLKLVRRFHSPVDILAENISSQAVYRVICFFDDICVINPVREG